MNANESITATIERLTAQLGEFAETPANVAGAIVDHCPQHDPQKPWRLYDDADSWEFATVAELEQAVSDYVAAMRSA